MLEIADALLKKIDSIYMTLNGKQLFCCYNLLRRYCFKLISRSIKERAQSSVVNVS